MTRTALPATAAPAPAFAATTGLARMEGFVTLHWDAAGGRVLLELPRLGEEFLYITRLAQGIGDLRLERGGMSRPQVVRFERRGPRLFLIAVNYAWRNSSGEPAQELALRQAFPDSILWGFDILEEAGGTLLVDATAFLLHDARDIAGTLSRAATRGRYTLDARRSALAEEGHRAFPRNSQAEAILTFANPDAETLPFWNGNGQREGLAALAPDPRAISIRLRHCFIALPEPGYRPREFDPRGSFFNSVVFHDFGRSLEEPFDVHYAIRHRLQKADPTAARSRPVKPLVYYVDRGAPEPIRSALLDGARWWNRAFEAAGFIDAFRVELLPEDADPLDIRFNTITWVPRGSRGFSYGTMIWDPRTGEIIKGEVTLTALRDRHLRGLAEALLAPYDDAKPCKAVEEFMLARLRQLSAHEVSHTLGLDHNHIASNHGQDMSVCDYPAPLLTLDEAGEVRLDAAYGTDVGRWDEISITWGYSEFPPGTTPEEEKRGLDAILEKAFHEEGLYTLAQQDALPENGMHPKGHHWDTGSDAAEELTRLMTVRAAALSRFGERVIKPGRPMAELGDRLTGLFLLHRYQLEAAVKLIGGLDWRYALRGDGQVPTALVPAADQRRALDVVLAALSPAALTLPEAILRAIPPRPPEFLATRDLLPGQAGAAFDPLGAAEAAATHGFFFVFHPQRAARLIEHHHRDASLPSLEEIFDTTLEKVWKAPAETGLARAVQLRIAQVALRHLMALGASPEASFSVRAVVRATLRRLAAWLETAPPPADALGAAEREAALAALAIFMVDPARFRDPATLPVPPGSPI
ncbi:zinc-dependent metalloprotease [Roseomonas sp. USHLN139]|uniref:zinc-dependent metalloprotease n=1 Tax=Roseomonas sp. USHLN139 TaxID=3081298 RepID=UPI003B020B0C